MVKVSQDEIMELLSQELILELEIDQITTDEIKPRKEERAFIRKRIKVLMSSESKDQVLMEFADKDSIAQ